jgi:hypothetical protein
VSASLDHGARRPGALSSALSLSLSSSLALALAVLWPGCGSSTPSPPEGPKGNVVLHDENNYASQSTLTIPTVQTAAGADLTVCWDGIAKDILCHDLMPATEIDNVSFLQIPNMSQSDVEAKLALGKLDENLVKIYRDFHVDHAVVPPTMCTKLSTLALGTKLDPTQDYVEAADKTYMLLFEHGTTPGVGARTMTFLVPTSTSASSNTAVAAPDGCSSHILDFHATLGRPIVIPANDDTKWLVDWSQITHDSFGNAFTFPKLDSVLVGFFAGKTVEDLQASFLDIEIIATSAYEVAVPAGARAVNLADATLRGGTAADTFPGFTRTDGVWLVAVRCSKCQVPAPVVLSILQPQ